MLCLFITCIKDWVLGVTQCVRTSGAFDDWDNLITPGIYQNGGTSMEKFGTLIVFNAGAYKVQLHFYFGAEHSVRWRPTVTDSFADVQWIDL